VSESGARSGVARVGAGEADEGMTTRAALDSLRDAGWSAARLPALREALTAAAPEDLPALAEGQPTLLLALLRRSGSLSAPAACRPLDARAACLVLGAEAARAHLRAVLLALPPLPEDPRADQRAHALRAAGERLIRLLGESPAGETPPPGQRERTLLRLLELEARQADPERPGSRPAALWGQGLLARMDGPRWFHPDLVHALVAMADPAAAGGEDGRRGALLRAAADLSVPGGLSDPELALRLGLQPGQLPVLGGGGRHA